MLRKQDKVFLKWEPTHFTLLRRDENFTRKSEVEESLRLPLEGKLAAQLTDEVIQVRDQSISDIQISCVTK